MYTIASAELSPVSGSCPMYIIHVLDLLSQSLNLLASIASASSADVPAPAARHLVWVCGCVRGKNEVWLCCDEKGKGRLGVVSLDDKATPHLEVTSCEVQ